jgi:type II secretory pathway pseudopilin PulG
MNSRRRMRLHVSFPPRRVAAEDGFTIVEVVVAIIVLVVGLLGALVLINSANATTAANKARTGGVNLAREVADASRAVLEDVPYSQLSSGCPAPSSPENPCPTTSPLVAALQAQPGLASSSSGDWQLERDGVDYTIGVAVCSMDDPADGAGSHATGGPFCPDVGAAGTVDRAPDDFKRLTVDVTWEGTRGSQETRSVALLQSDGANGPSVTCLRPTSSPCPASSTPVIDQASTTSMQFTATVSGPVERLVWYVDGSFQDTLTPSGGSASFTWDLGTVASGTGVADGTYEISATAFDSNGRSGTIGSLQVVVNRRAPEAPGAFAAGRNSMIAGNSGNGGVDLNWLPVTDKDVLYYRIFREDLTGSTLIKTTDGSGVTSYTDKTSPINPTPWVTPCTTDPPQAALTTLEYRVVAVDQNGATPREGTPTASIDVNRCNTPPEPPPSGALGLTENGDGTITLDGALPPSPSDPDAGDEVASVRIYRWSGTPNPSDVADRLELVPVEGASFTYTDPAPEPGGVEQNYCFTNVDSRLQESTCSNVVTG